MSKKPSAKMAQIGQLQQVIWDLEKAKSNLNYTLLGTEMLGVYNRSISTLITFLQDDIDRLWESQSNAEEKVDN